MEIVGGEVTGGGDKAAIGWEDAIDVRPTVKTTIGSTVVSVCLVLGEKFDEKL